MSAIESRPVLKYNRRQVLAWSGAAAAVVATSRFAGTALAQATPTATTSTFLDPGTVHDIAVTFDQATYDAMIETFSNFGDKEWIEATVTIDGSTYEQAGMRLKGNSSLGGLLINGDFPVPMPTDGATPVAGASGSSDEPSTNVRQGEEPAEKTAEQLPWLIRLDKFVDDQNHEGITDLVIRSNHSATSLNEAVALDLLSAAGLASQQAASVRFTVNDSAPALRLAIELPNDAWMAVRFPEGGLLYKAEAGGDWSYRGDDPADYKDVFDLEAGDTGDDAADFQPLFDFLAFLNDSDDETFAAELGTHLDTDTFATYLAMMDLMGNFDDISGPGNNAYIHVGPDDTRFTVVPWDMNLAFGSMGMGMRGPMNIGELPEGEEGGSIEIVINGTPVAESDFIGEGERRPGPGPTNALVTRCNDTAPGFTDLVAETRSQLQASLYDSGDAAEILAGWADLLREQAADLVDEATIATESDAITTFFTQES